MKLQEIIYNEGQIEGLPANPRIIKNEKLKQLADSILMFPKMMRIRPIVIDENNICLGGSMRCRSLRIIKNMGKDDVKKYLSENNREENLKEIEPLFEGNIPEGWVSKETNLTLEQKKEFILKDNNQSGMYDFDILLNEWGRDVIDSYGIDIPDNLFNDVENDDDFIKRFNSIDDSNAIYPIIPKVGEKHELFIIVSDDEVDSNYLREKFGMQKMKSYKSDKIQKSNVIHIKDVINAMQNSNTVL